MTQQTLISAKMQLRKLMKAQLKSISSEEMTRQTKIVVDHLLKENKHFVQAKHIGLFISMKNQEINTIQKFI